MFKEIAESNLTALKNNSYTGRGIIIGGSPDGKHLVQVYWIMGRSKNTRNRVFINENGFVRTKAFNELNVADPTLYIYYPVKYIGDCHIVSNGDQTDTIYDCISKDMTFEDALNSRQFEYDPPHFTPRISGIIKLGDKFAYKLSILKSQDGNPDYNIRNYFTYEKVIQGIGHCIHVYKSDGDPRPSFIGEPYILPIYSNIDDTLEAYWSTLNNENKVAILVKFIDASNGD